MFDGWWTGMVVDIHITQITIINTPVKYWYIQNDIVYEAAGKYEFSPVLSHPHHRPSPHAHISSSLNPMTIQPLVWPR